MNIKHQLSWRENVRLIQAHFHINQNQVALILGVPETTLSYNLRNDNPNHELKQLLWDFIQKSHDNWGNPSYWKPVIQTLSN